MKTVSITQFLTEAEIQRALELWNKRTTDRKIGWNDARCICDEIIRPNIERIKRALGQENDPMYLAYAVEFVMMQASGGKL